MAPFFMGGYPSETANRSSLNIRIKRGPTANGGEAGLSLIAQACALPFDTVSGGYGTRPQVSLTNCRAQLALFDVNEGELLMHI